MHIKEENRNKITTTRQSYLSGVNPVIIEFESSLKINVFRFIPITLIFSAPKPKFSFRHLKQGIQEFRRKFVLAPADKAANNVVIV